MAKLTEKLNFQITPDLRRQLFEFAKKKGWSVSLIIREAIKEYLERRDLVKPSTNTDQAPGYYKKGRGMTYKTKKA